MPKIIENLPERLAEEARRQIEESGFSAMTIRSVAKACGVGVGTVYNYFPSKEALVATFMLTDWNNCIAAIQSCADESDTVEPVLKTIHEQLQLFMAKFDSIFRDESAVSSYSGALTKYHSILRNQLAAPIRKFCRDDFTAEFIAEAVLTWTVAGKDFDELKNILLRIN
jgi:AcrR family transcriptional regulator